MSESMTAAPFRDCTALAVHQVNWGKGSPSLWGLRGKAFVIAYGHIWKITYRFLTRNQTPQGPHMLLHRTVKQLDMITQLPLRYFYILLVFPPVSSTSSMNLSSFSFLGPVTYRLSPLSYLTITSQRNSSHQYLKTVKYLPSLRRTGKPLPNTVFLQRQFTRWVTILRLLLMASISLDHYLTFLISSKSQVDRQWNHKEQSSYENKWS